jgi:outer membrane protein assembly factor BamA
MRVSHLLPKALLLLPLLFILPELNAQTEDGEVILPESFAGPYVKVTEIEVTGNKRTREQIITRELDFKLNDSLAVFQAGTPKFGLFEQKRLNQVDSSEVVQRMKYSRENIINTQLFLSATLTLEEKEGGDYTLLIDVNERWYFWVFPVIKLDHPNFNDWLKDPDFSQFTQGIFMSHNNLWGLSHQGSVLGYFGSSTGAGLGYYIPWIGKGQKIGLRLGALYRNSTVVEYGSLENERLITYEEGSTKEYNFLTTFTMRPGLYNYGKLRLTANHINVSDNLYNLTQNDSVSSFLPEGEKDATHIDLYVEYAYDSRNNRAYPLKGNYMKGFVDKRGLGILGHKVDYFYYGVDMHFYQKISERWYAAEMFNFIASSGENIPYHYKQHLNSGKGFVRGYDYFALRGDDLYYFRSNIKYNVIKPGIMPARKEKHKDSKFRNLPYAFYINLIADVGFVREDTYGAFNPYNNRGLYSWGIGLDFISYYDLVLRFEYVFTIIGTHGFYFGFGMPV